MADPKPEDALTRQNEPPAKPQRDISDKPDMRPASARSPQQQTPEEREQTAQKREQAAAEAAEATAEQRREEQEAEAEKLAEARDYLEQQRVEGLEREHAEREERQRIRQQGQTVPDPFGMTAVADARAAEVTGPQPGDEILLEVPGRLLQAPQLVEDREGVVYVTGDADRAVKTTETANQQAIRAHLYPNPDADIRRMDTPLSEVARDITLSTQQAVTPVEREDGTVDMTDVTRAAELFQLRSKTTPGNPAL
jgi:hypothetical protein